MPDQNKQGKLIVYLPNVITFLSLISGLVSILLSSQGLILLAAWSILMSVFLDFWDGYLARKLNLASEFGLQLDSLVDIVCFGVAPMLLIWQHLDLELVRDIWVLPILFLLVIAGAFRLARFNLQAPKQVSSGQTLGITISQSGMVLALAVLSDLSLGTDTLPIWMYCLLAVFLSYIMTSRLVFPSPSWYVPTKLFYLIYFLLGAILIYFSSVYTMVLVIYLGGLIVSASRQIIFPSI